MKSSELIGLLQKLPADAEVGILCDSAVEDISELDRAADLLGTAAAERAAAERLGRAAEKLFVRH